MPIFCDVYHQGQAKNAMYEWTAPKIEEASRSTSILHETASDSTFLWQKQAKASFSLCLLIVPLQDESFIHVNICLD